MTNVPRALVVGASETAALLHLPVLARLQKAGQLELVEICDLRHEAAAAARHRFGFAREGGEATSAMHRSDIDLVYLFGGASMHHTLGLAALRAGKHLFVEKPIAPTYSEAIELAAAADERGLIAVGGHNRRFLSSFDCICSEHAFGSWTFAEAVFHKSEFGRPPPFGAGTWLSGNAIHALDALLFMMGGLPEWLGGEAGGSGQTAAVFTAMMRWRRGARAIFISNNEAGGRREEYAFHAPGETWSITDQGLTLERNGLRKSIDVIPHDASFAAEHDAFLSAVALGRAPRHAIAELAPSLFLAELIEAGYHGQVRLPAPPRTSVGMRKDQTVMLVGAERLRAALGMIPSYWRLVSIEEVERSPECRPDIVAAIHAPGSAPIADRTLDKLPNLLTVGIVGLSVRRYGADRLLDRGIELVNASCAYAESVAEFALGLAILGRRRAFNSWEAMRGGGWGTQFPAKPWRASMLHVVLRLRPIFARLGIEEQLRRWWRSKRTYDAHLASAATVRELSGALVGLIGWGANARAFAKRLTAAGSRVIVHSEYASDAEIRDSGAEPAPLARVLAADVVSLHRGLSPATRHCLGRTELACLMPGAVLINIARGALIDPKALVERLSRGDIVACLDTFDEEPLPRRHPLRRMRNVFLTAHIAGSSEELRSEACREVILKLQRRLDGGHHETITRQRLASMT